MGGPASDTGQRLPVKVPKSCTGSAIRCAEGCRVGYTGDPRAIGGSYTACFTADPLFALSTRQSPECTRLALLTS